MRKEISHYSLSSFSFGTSRVTEIIQSIPNRYTLVTDLDGCLAGLVPSELASSTFVNDEKCKALMAISQNSGNSVCVVTGRSVQQALKLMPAIESMPLNSSRITIIGGHGCQVWDGFKKMLEYDVPGNIQSVLRQFRESFKERLINDTDDPERARSDTLGGVFETTSFEERPTGVPVHWRGQKEIERTIKRIFNDLVSEDPYKSYITDGLLRVMVESYNLELTIGGKGKDSAIDHIISTTTDIKHLIIIGDGETDKAMFNRVCDYRNQGISSTIIVVGDLRGQWKHDEVPHYELEGPRGFDETPENDEVWKLLSSLADSQRLRPVDIGSI